MTRLFPGMLIKTNYSGPYKIKAVERNCICPHVFDDQPRAPHLFITATDLDGQGEFYLDGFEDETLRSLEKTYCGLKQEPDYDHIEILPQPAPIQMTLF
jgi:hypothetical protein